MPILRTSSMLLMFCCAWYAASLCVGAPVAQEPIVEGSSGYPREWPVGTLDSSAPDWAQPGAIRFARWDGGPIETAKGFLSGWPGLNPPDPDYVFVTTNWYDPSTIRFLRDGGFNFIWGTFSAGFSVAGETVQRDLLRTYIEECHGHGIHVLAYESIANIFWEEMYRNMPESKNWISKGSDGEPIAYLAGDYSKMGRVTRFMADVTNPEWRALLKKRVDLAIEAGADGVAYDNCLAPNNVEMARLFQELMQHAQSRKAGFLIAANLHRDKYVLNRLLNCITTEDGGEAGVFSEPNLMRCYRKRERPYLLPVEDGFLVNNIGLFRTFENLAEGRKPVMIESNFREIGMRETDYMGPRRQQLAMAEPMMFGVSNEAFVDLRFARDLYRSEPEAVAAWKAIGHYNRFFAEHTEYYCGARSLATLAVVLDNRSEGQAVMNGLAARNVLFHVLYEHELTREKLKPYAAVALLATETVRDRAMEALRHYVNDGGKLFAVGHAATKDETGTSRPQPEWLGRKPGEGEAVYWEKLPPIDELAEALLSADAKPIVRVQTPKGVLFNVTEQMSRGRWMIHIINYLPKQLTNVVVTVRGKQEQIEMLTPDKLCDPPRVVRSSESVTEIEIPRLDVYSIVLLKARQPSPGREP